MYVLLSGVPPFNGANDEEIFDKVRVGKYSFAGKFENYYNYRSIMEKANSGLNGFN